MPNGQGERLAINQQQGSAVVQPTATNAATPESRVRRGAKTDVESSVLPTNSQTQALTTRFLFGTTIPAIVCGVGHVCDLEFQVGEKLISPIRIGDKDRWGLDVVVVSQPNGEIPHLTIMPADFGLETSIIVLTNRRTYHIKLASSRTFSMPHSMFSYPDELASRWDSAPSVQK